MLSASTFSSSSSSGFSASDSSLTPSSQLSIEFQSSSNNPLNELIATEQSYMETLKMIDSQLAPIWMKQMTSAAPDFSELLKYAHDVLTVNRKFYLKLTRISTKPQAISELGDVLMQWVDELEVPYANYCRSFIPNLNKRRDIVENQAINNLLNSLSSRVSYEVSLESLFNAPIQQLKYYKSLYSRLLESTDSGRADHKILISANKKIDTIMVLSQNSTSAKSQSNNYSSLVTSSMPSLPFIKTNFQSSTGLTDPELTAFERQVDCSRTVDLLNGTQISYQLRIANPGAQLIMRDMLIMLPDDGGPSIPVHLVLTKDSLVICRELSKTQFLLLYPAVPINDVVVKSESLDREVVGEYLVRFTLMGKRDIIVRADSKEVRNVWVGVASNAPSSATLTPRNLSDVVRKKTANKDASHSINQPTAAVAAVNHSVSRNTDIFTFYSEGRGVSPASSSDEDEDEEEEEYSDNWKKTNQGKSRDTIMDIYDNLDDYGDETFFPLPPVPPIPPAKNTATVSANDSSHVQMTFIEAPTAQMATMSIAPPIPEKDDLNQPNPPPISSSNQNISPSGIKNFDGRPASPRAVEVQRAVIPEAMQAVTQKTNDYLSTNSQDNASANPLGQKNDLINLPRTSSIRSQVSYRPPHGPSQSPTLNNPHMNQTGPGLPQPSVLNNPQMGPPRPYPNQSPIMMNSHPRPMMNQLPMMMNGQPPAMMNGQPPAMMNGQPPAMMNGQPPAMMNSQPPAMMNNQQRPMMGYTPYGAPRSAPSLPVHTQQFRTTSPQSPQPTMYNNNRPLPMTPTGNSPNSHINQRPPPRFNPSPSLGNNQLQSPPQSPGPFSSANDIKKILYSNSKCDVFHWNNQSWYAAEGQCLLQVKQTYSGRTCVSVVFQNSGQPYLNAWILPTTVIRKPSPTDVNISLFLGNKKENYLFHFDHPQDANVFADILYREHQQSSMTSPVAAQPFSEVEELEPVDNINVPQTLKPVMQCKAKLFIKNETSNWSTFGSVTMRISQQSPSLRMMIQIENEKTKLVSATVKSGNVERISPKRISFLLNDDTSKTSIVYMIHLREDQTGNKIYEYLRTKNAENGW